MFRIRFRLDESPNFCRALSCHILISTACRSNATRACRYGSTPPTSKFKWDSIVKWKGNRSFLASYPTRSPLFKRLATESAPSSSGSGGTTVKPKKKRKIFRKTLLYSTALVTTAYGVGTAAAVNDERVHDFFTEKVPFGEQIVDFAESHGYVGGLPRAAVDPAFTPRRQRPTPSSPSTERAAPPAMHEKAEALKARVEGHVKDRKERIRDVAAQLHAQKERGPARGIVPANIERGTAAPLPPAYYSEGAGELVNEVEAALKGEPESAITKLVDTVLNVKPSPGTAHPAISATSYPEASKAEKQDNEEVTPPQGKQWYDGPTLRLGFEPPPGYSVRPPKKVPKTTAGLLLVAPAVEEFTGSEPLLKELAGTVDNLAKYLEDNPKAEKGVNKILEAAKKDIADLGSKITSTQEDAKKQLESKLEEQTKSYSVKLLEAELESRDKLDSQDEEWRKYFDQERLSLLQKYQEKLDDELATQKDLINQRYGFTIALFSWKSDYHETGSRKRSLRRELSFNGDGSVMYSYTLKKSAAAD